MEKINIGKRFGKFLMGRQEGSDSFIALEHITKDQRDNNEKILCDLSEVLVLNSSFADEMFGEYERKYPDTMVLNSKMNSTCKKAFDVITEVHNVKFTYNSI